MLFTLSYILYIIFKCYVGLKIYNFIFIFQLFVKLFYFIYQMEFMLKSSVISAKQLDMSAKSIFVVPTQIKPKLTDFFLFDWVWIFSDLKTRVQDE